MIKLGYFCEQLGLLDQIGSSYDTFMNDCGYSYEKWGYSFESIRLLITLLLWMTEVIRLNKRRYFCEPLRLLVWFIEVTCINEWCFYYKLIGSLITLNETTHRLNDIISMS